MKDLPNRRKIIKINNIIFTAREIDVIACIVSIRRVKKIASILSISHRTVEGHIQNILLKTSLNSQESIKDFVEESSELILIKRHYCDLLIQSVFEQQLKKISSKIKRKENACIVNYTQSKKLDFILKYLEFANIHLIKRPIDKPFTGKKTIILLSHTHLEELKNGKMFKEVIFLCLDERLKSEFLSNLDDIQIIDASGDNDIYFIIFKILKRLVPSVDFEDPISYFNKLRNNVVTLKVDIIGKTFDTKEEKIEKNWSTKNMIIAIISVLIIGALLFVFLYHNYNKNYKIEQYVIGTNFLIPHENIILRREGVLHKIEKILKIEKEIRIALLIGPGGAGKTTIARQYALEQGTSIIWEVNAETKDSLLLSLEKMIYSLNKSVEEKLQINKLLKVKDEAKRESILLTIVQSALKKNNNWFIIFDNVENLQDIYNYFPSTSKIWGRGKIIITTRNQNAKNNNYIDKNNSINIGPINEQEKLELFSKIIVDKLPVSDELLHDMKMFLEQIPSFPLDVSVAAYYIKNTGLQYDVYLKNLSNLKKVFTELQKTILINSSEYNKTRYNIVSLSIQNILKYKPEYLDLLLLTSTFDSQDIPEDFLIYYKGEQNTKNFIRELKKTSFITNIAFKNNNSHGIDNLSTFSIHRSTKLNILVYMLEFLDISSRKKLLDNIIQSLQNYVFKLVKIEDLGELKNLIHHNESLLNNNHKMFSDDNLSSIESALGIIYYYLGNDKSAKKLLEKNLDGQEEGKQKARVLTHLGAIYRKLGKNYKLAINSLEHAISIYQKLSIQDVEEGLALTHLGNTYRTLGNFDKAAKALSKSVDVYRNNPGNYTGEARALAYLGVVYREKGELEKAMTFLEEGLEIYNREEYPKYSSVYAGTLAHLGITYRMLGELEKAKELLENSSEIYKQIRPEDHSDIGRNTLNLGIIYGELKNNNKANLLLNKSVLDYEINYGKNHIETAKVLNHLGRFYIISENPLIADEVLQRAYNILSSGNHPEAYRSLELLGDLHITDNKEKATKFYNESLQLALLYFKDESTNIVRLNRKLNALKKDE